MLSVSGFKVCVCGPGPHVHQGAVPAVRHLIAVRCQVTGRVAWESQTRPGTCPGLKTGFPCGTTGEDLSSHTLDRAFELFRGVSSTWLRARHEP